MAITLVKQGAINTMSIILAIACSDRIVVAADGRSTDFETKKPKSDVPKMFRLTQNSVILVSGEGFLDSFQQSMDELVHSIRSIGNTNITELAQDVKENIDRRNWAAYKDNYHDSHMDVLVAGYDGVEPRICEIKDNRDFSWVWSGVCSVWDDAQTHLVNSISVESQNNSKKLGNKVAIEMLTMAEQAHKNEIGGQSLIWHISPDGIHELSKDDIARLTKRHGKNSSISGINQA